MPDRTGLTPQPNADAGIVAVIGYDDPGAGDEEDAEEEEEEDPCEDLYDATRREVTPEALAGMWARLNPEELQGRALRELRTDPDRAVGYFMHLPEVAFHELYRNIGSRGDAWDPDGVSRSFFAFLEGGAKGVLQHVLPDLKLGDFFRLDALLRAADAAAAERCAREFADGVAALPCTTHYRDALAAFTVLSAGWSLVERYVVEENGDRLWAAGEAAVNELDGRRYHASDPAFLLHAELFGVPAGEVEEQGDEEEYDEYIARLTDRIRASGSATRVRASDLPGMDGVRALYAAFRDNDITPQYL